VRLVTGSLRPHQSDQKTALSRIGRASYCACLGRFRPHSVFVELFDLIFKEAPIHRNGWALDFGYGTSPHIVLG
jgi:hypothetical protein